MTHMPLRLRAMKGGQTLVVNDAGRFFAGSADFLARLADEKPTIADETFLRKRGHVVADDDALGKAAFVRGVADRIVQAGPLDYLILVPTLRCNLACSYCQVSRVAEKARGFDWDDATLEAVLPIIDGLTSDRVKIEFQGGEPTLRPDLIQAVIDRCARFDDASSLFAPICSGWMTRSLRSSTGPSLHQDLARRRQSHARPQPDGQCDCDRWLPRQPGDGDRAVRSEEGVGASNRRPAPPPADELIDAYVIGIDSIFLRPINYQGSRASATRIARTGSRTGALLRGLRAPADRAQLEDRSRVFEETYLCICLRRIFRPGARPPCRSAQPQPDGSSTISSSTMTAASIRPTRRGCSPAPAWLTWRSATFGLGQAKRDLLNAARDQPVRSRLRPLRFPALLRARSRR